MREGGPRTARPWFALIAALVALGLAVPAAQSSPPGGPTIVNGEPAGATEFPAQSFLEFDIDDDGAWDWYCGGTLVAPTKILTAAHCATDFGEEVPAGGVTAYLGETDRRDFAASHRYLVSDVEVHANFNPNSLVNDVAMLTLASASPQQPLRVIRADETAKWAPGVTATIVGWGTTSYGGEESDTLLKAQVPIVSDASCRATYGSEFRAASMVCAYDGTHDTCQGDSGGPLMVPEDGGGLVLAGITSWGYGCADEDYPGVYTRIGATGLNTWIHSRLPASAPPPPPPAPPAPPPAPPPPPPSPPPPSPPPPAPTPPPPTPPAAPPPAPPPTPPAPPPPVEPAPQPQPRVVRCVVPRLTGRTLLSARRALARANCRLGRVTRSYSARVSFGRVIRQQPATGRRLARYARVSVVVSRGKRKR